MSAAVVSGDLPATSARLPQEKVQGLTPHLAVVSSRSAISGCALSTWVPEQVLPSCILKTRSLARGANSQLTLDPKGLSVCVRVRVRVRVHVHVHVHGHVHVHVRGHGADLRLHA